MNENTELRACPFCGGNAEYGEVEDHLGGIWSAVRCSTCGADRPGQTEADAAAKWNTRTPEPAEPVVSGHHESCPLHWLKPGQAGAKCWCNATRPAEPVVFPSMVQTIAQVLSEEIGPAITAARAADVAHEIAAALSTRPAEPPQDVVEAYRTQDESGSPESAGTVAWNWIGELAQRERGNDATLLVTGLTEAKAHYLYRGTRLLAVATTFRDDMNCTVLVRWAAPDCAALASEEDRRGR